MQPPNHFCKNECWFKKNAFSFGYQADQVRVVAADCSETRPKASPFPASSQKMGSVAGILVSRKPQEFLICELGHSHRLVGPS